MTVGGSPFDGARAYEHLRAICELGPRTSGSAEMTRQREMLAEHFRNLGAKVETQEFTARNPVDGSPLAMTNLIVVWQPEKQERILLSTHYDTRPFPDQDPFNPRGRFVGANDGASGVALLMELGRHMPQFDGRYGVDFVFFDGEEQIYNERFDPYFLGSSHFARSYVNDKPPHKYVQGVLLDMVADRELQVFYEKNSFELAPELSESIWKTAAELGVQEFVPRVKHEVRDDHLPLNNIAGIPTCDIIDFDYPRPNMPRPYWHTEADVPSNCSAESLAKVGAVVLAWLKTTK